MAGEDEFRQRLAQARAALAEAAASPEEGRVAPVTAEAAKGRISLTLGTDGRVERIIVDPKAVKEGTDYIAEHVLAALNDALDQRAAMTAAEDRVPDLESVNESLAAVQDAGVRRLQAMSASIAEVLGKLNRN